MAATQSFEGFARDLNAFIYIQCDSSKTNSESRE